MTNPAPVVLNDLQMRVLKWIADGSPAGVMEGYSHRVSAVALRTRELVTIRGRGPTWRAALTATGEEYLENPPPTYDIPRQPGAPSGRLTKPAGKPQPGDGADEPPGRDPDDPPADNAIPIPSRLTGAHPFLIATREAAVGLKAEDYGRLRIGPCPGVLHMVISRSQLRRALVIAQAVIGEAKRRGWEIVAYEPRYSYSGRAGVAVEIRGHAYPIEVHEPTETLPFTDQQIEAWRTQRTWWDTKSRAGKMPPPQHKSKQPTGKLRFSLPNGYGGGRANWTEGARGPLEEKLWSIFRVLEERADYADEAAIQAQIRAAEREREEQARAERARQVRIEKERAERLLSGSRLWQRAEEVRAYVGALESRLPDLDPPERDRVAAWCRWSRDWIDNNDPVANTRLIVGTDDQGDACPG